MSRETERVLVTNTFLAAWDEVTWPVKMENVKFNEPDNGQFAHFIIVTGESERLTLGTNHISRSTSYLQVDCYLPLDGGTKRYNEIEDLLIDTFDDRQITTTDGELITFRRVQTKNFGQYFGKYRRTFTVEFHRDIHHA